MSWLSPKRRRTTGALPTVQKNKNNENATTNGHNDAGASDPESPTAAQRTLSTPKSEPRPDPMHTPSSSVGSTNGVMNGSGASDSLFYAYARKADDPRSRYLLTFASASTANEWWSLLSTHFPSTSRPGPQLFTFANDDLLSRAWKHAAFAHLQSKWMYIQFNDFSNAGGAAQGIIPLQDASGNLLGGSSAGAAENIGQMRKEARVVKNELGVLEGHFERMMEAVERNSEQIAQLAKERKESEVARGKEVEQERQEGQRRGEGYLDTAELSGHLGRIGELLERNSAHVEALAQRQHESETKLREALESSQAQQPRAESTDLGKLEKHLDRIQIMMEKSVHGRKDSARDGKGSPPSQVDYAPLTDRLEKVLVAVEQNSELMRDLLGRDGIERQLGNDRLERKLDELIQVHKESAKGLPTEPLELDVSPLSQRLDDLLDAQEVTAKRQQLSEEKVTTTLEKILDMQGKAVDRGPFDVSLLSQRLDEILSQHRHAATEPLVQKLQEIVDSQERIGALEWDFTDMTSRLDDLIAEVARSRDAMDFAPIVETLESLRNATQQQSEYLTSLPNHLQALRTATAKTNNHLAGFLQAQTQSSQALTTTTGSGSNSTSAVDFTPLTDRLAQISTALERQQRTPSPSEANGGGSGDAKFLLSALSSHLSRIQALTESNASTAQTHHKSLRNYQNTTSSAVSQISEEVRTLVNKCGVLETRGGVREGVVNELVRAQGEMVESVRGLAVAIKEEGSGRGCGHVVVPPPRKTGRKVVGFVYEGDGGGKGGGGGK